MILPLLLFAAALGMQADVRARIADQEERERIALASAEIPGRDISDAVVDGDARALCGAAPECGAKVRAARDGLVRAYALNKGKRKTIDRVLAEAVTDGHINWVEAEARAADDLPAVSSYSRTTVRCSSYWSKNRVYSTCSIW